MPNRLDLPPELASLIEKREQEERRQQDRCAEVEGTGDPARAAGLHEERRTANDRRDTDSGGGDSSANDA